MTSIKILFIEDSLSDIEAMEDTNERFSSERKVDIQITSIKSKDEYDKLTNLYDFDAIICDIVIPQSEHTAVTKNLGNELLEDINSKPFNMPIVIVTGTRDNISCDDGCYLDIFVKGQENLYYNVLTKILSMYEIGIMDVIGMKGTVTKYLKNIYNNHIKPQIVASVWEEHYNKKRNTRGILLRYVANIIQSRLINACGAVPEEMYLIPSGSENIATGTILKKNDAFYVVLNPECDLVLRNTGKPNTDFVLLCNVKSNFKVFKKQNLDNIKKYKSNYVYCLPKNKLFDTSYLNFRDIYSAPYDDVLKNYEIVGQITNPFTKEIIQKFSSYYSRQGQPDVDETSFDMV
jgi:response regulator receiver protein